MTNTEEGVDEHCHQIMDRQIFNIGLGVLATSAYIVITSLTGENHPAVRSAVLGRWTISEAELDTALAELQGRGILSTRPGPGGEILYVPLPAPLWR